MIPDLGLHAHIVTHQLFGGHTLHLHLCKYHIPYGYGIIELYYNLKNEWDKYTYMDLHIEYQLMIIKNLSIIYRLKSSIPLSNISLAIKKDMFLCDKYNSFKEITLEPT